MLNQKYLIPAATFVLGIAVGLNLAPVVEPATNEPDRDYETLRKSYWWALGLKERRENQLNDLSKKTGVQWGEENANP